MRHIAEIKLSKELQLDEKIDLLTELKTEVNLLSYTDMQSSLMGSKKLDAYFTINSVDDGQLTVERTSVTLSTTLNFSKLITVYEIAKAFLGENVVDFKYPEMTLPDEGEVEEDPEP